MIPFNKPFLIGRELDYIRAAVESLQLSGNGQFTAKCHRFFEERHGFAKVLLTSSCTDALEMAALLLDIRPGDEVIVPSYTFVSSANAFVLRGASIVFADSCTDNPNVDPQSIEAMISPRTKAIVVVHYAGVSCDMNAILAIAQRHAVAVVEDAAHAIDSFYKGRRLGSLGALGTFSFHETKNVIAGEGGMLAVNRPEYRARAEILWEKGTNRAAFARGQVSKYNWVDIGSSFLPSEIVSAFLFAQLEHIEQIQRKRVALWHQYRELLAPLAERGLCQLPEVPRYATVNGHLFYVLARSAAERDGLLEYLNRNGVHAVFHYLPLHLSPFHRAHERQPASLPNAERFSERLLRLPLFYELEPEQVEQIAARIQAFYGLR